MPLDFFAAMCEESRVNSILEVTEMERSFLNEHLSLWRPVFCQKMIEQSLEGFSRGIARLTIGLVEYDQCYTKKIISNSTAQAKGY